MTNTPTWPPGRFGTPPRVPPWSRPTREPRILAVDRDGPVYAWAVVTVGASDARPASRPRYLQHGRLLPKSARPIEAPEACAPEPARVREVLSDLVRAYEPVLLVLTARPPLREASEDDPYAFLAAARARGVPVEVLEPHTLKPLPAPGPSDLVAFHGLKARPGPEGACRALAAATAAALALSKG